MTLDLPPTSSSSKTNDVIPHPLISGSNGSCAMILHLSPHSIFASILQCFVVSIPNVMVSVEERLVVVESYIVSCRLGACAGERRDLTVTCIIVTVQAFVDDMTNAVFAQERRKNEILFHHIV